MLFACLPLRNEFNSPNYKETKEVGGTHNILVQCVDVSASFQMRYFVFIISIPEILFCVCLPYQISKTNFILQLYEQKSYRR